MKGQPDLMTLNYHRDFKGLCIEFKSPTNNYRVFDAYKEMKKEYLKNGYAYILCNDYDRICKAVHEYMDGIRLPCKHCGRLFKHHQSLATHHKIIHSINNGKNRQARLCLLHVVIILNVC